MNLSKSTKNDWVRGKSKRPRRGVTASGASFPGGLNLQIEHHLFPGCAHNLYPKMVPIIKDECKKAGLAYTGYGGYFGLLPITRDMFSYLHKMGHQRPKAM